MTRLDRWRDNTATASSGNAAVRRLSLLGLGFVVFVVLLVALVSIGRPRTLPDEASGMAPSAGSFNSFLLQVTGKRVTTDFLPDYASADALRDGVDPYQVGWQLIDRSGGPAWPVSTANTHPPTLLTLLLPFTAFRYENSLAAFSILMIFGLVATIRLMGVRLTLAIPLGIVTAMLYPGAYAIGNPVPIIGLGIAMAYRYRHEPLLAGVGLALAAAPKASGLLLVIPFLVTARWKAVAWAAGFMVVLAGVPLLYFRRTWATYLSAGRDGIELNADRWDNASVLKFAERHDISEILMLMIVVVGAAVLAVVVRDTFFPVVWFLVAALPIAWMYSMLTLIPLWVMAIKQGRAIGLAPSVVAIGLMAASPPLYTWPTRLVPIILLLSGVALLGIREGDFWPSSGAWRDMLRKSAIDSKTGLSEGQVVEAQHASIPGRA